MTDLKLKLSSPSPFALKLSSPGQLVGRVLPYLPGTLIGGTGIDVVQSGTTYNISWNPTEAGFSAFGLQLGGAANAAAARALLGARAQRSVTASPITVGGTDEILNCNISSGSPACTLPQASTRGGKPVTFKDVGARFLAHPLALTPFAGDSIDGNAAGIVLNVNGQAVTLVPFNDGTNTGWALQ
jgi:hypothetical protein